MRLLYKTERRKSTKYESFQNEYYQNGNIVERYTTTWTKIPGRLERDETRTKEIRSLSGSWEIDDPRLPQWLKKYIVVDSDSELSTEEYIVELKEKGFRVYLWGDGHLTMLSILLIMPYGKIKIIYRSTFLIQGILDSLIVVPLNTGILRIQILKIVGC